MNSDESQMGMLDRLCDEFEAAWKSDQRPQLEAFLKRVDVELQLPQAEHLIPLDIEYRRKNGMPVGPKQNQSLGLLLTPLAAKWFQGIESNDLCTAEYHINQAELGVRGNRTFEGKIHLRNDGAPTYSMNNTPGRTQQIGPYKLLQKLSEYGIGSV